MMNDHDRTPRALFLAPNGDTYPDTLVCSGVLPSDLGGKPCQLSDNGRIPLPRSLDPREAGYSVDKGKPGDLCPPCALHHLGSLAHWQDGEQHFPAELLPLRLFKCCKWFWLVVPGLYHDAPQRIEAR